MTAVTMATTMADTSSERGLQNGLGAGRVGEVPPSSGGSNLKHLLRSPQISVEQVDGKVDGGKPRGTAHHLTSGREAESQVAHAAEASGGEDDDSYLKVASRGRVYCKSASLPMSSSLERYDDQDVRHKSPSMDADSSAYNSSEYSDDVDQDLSQASSSRVVPHMPRSKTLDSTDLYEDSSPELSSDEESTLGTARMILPSATIDPDDEVFEFGDIDICNEADTKLVDWAYNVFVPACKTLLFRCADGDNSELSSGQIIADLRSLSNTINYFCTEQQRLSGQLRFNVRGVSSSLSTDRFHRLRNSKNFDPRLINGNTASMSSDSASASSSGFEDSHYDRSYAVKILRSVSQSLIAPLLHDSESGFTSDLYKSIVQAIQKIAWKVEACLSFNDPTKDFHIYSQIYNEESETTVRGMMIRALPPEEPKLQSSVGRSSRSGSLSVWKSQSSTKDDALLEAGDSSHVIRRTPSSRARPSGGVFGSASDDTDAAKVPGGVSARCVSGEYDSLLEARVESPTSPQDEVPAAGRRRIATYTSPQRVSQKWEGSDLETHKEAEFTESTKNRLHYFRPSYHRRTTVSLSRRDVCKLGLTVAKRVDDSIVGGMGGERGTEEAGKDVESVETQMKEVKNRLEELTQGFDKDLQPRNRSASTSDLLADPPKGKRAEHHGNQRTRNRSCKSEEEHHKLAAKQASIESPNIDDHLKKSYTPSMKRQASDPHVSQRQQEIGGGWTLIDPSASFDASRVRADTKNSKLLVEKGGTKKAGSRAKKAVEKSLSASGRFTHKLVKTAQALRRGSVSTSKRKQLTTSVVSASMDELMEEPHVHGAAVSSVEGPRKVSSKSEPPSPMPKSETMPTSKRKKGTLPRISRRLKSSTNSLGRSHGRKSKSGGFLASQSFAESASTAALTESIYRLSNNAVQPSQETVDQLLISVEYSSKMSKSHRKRASLISTSSSSMWYEITVMTNMKRLGRSHYSILRTLKQVLALYDVLTTSYPDEADSFPDRPGKKSSVKLQKQQVEDFLHHLSQSPELRPSDAFVLFLMPDEEFGNFSENSEISFELLMTFYTPDMYPGPPGSHSEIQMVSPEDVPSKYTPSPARSRKHSSLQKRGTMHYLKKEGKEDGSTFVIREEGQDALIVSCEDERYMVVAGTFEKLVEQLACEEKPDPRFVLTFLLGYRHFASTTDLLSLLLSRFHMAVPPDATEEEISYAEKWRYVIQLRVLDVLTYWLKKCWPDFYRDESVLEKVREFIGQLKESQDTNFQLAGTNLEKVLADMLAHSDHYTSPNKATSPVKAVSPTSSVPTTPTCHASPHSSTASPAPLTSSESARSSFALDAGPSPRQTILMDITSISSIQLARQLTLIELEALRTIDTHELVVYTWEPNTLKNKPYRRNIDEYIARFNKLSFWVCSEILSINDAKVRGLIIEKFVEVAKHCQENRNFNSTISIMSGLSLAAVRRLKKSWEFVNEKWRKCFEKMALIMSPANNHISYRRLLSTVQRKDACIPYFGVFMRDLTFFNDGNQKTLKNGLLNFSKLRTMVYKFEELKRYQRSKYFFPPEDRIQEFCRNLWCLSETDLYETSLELEPREAPPPPPPEETDV